MECKTCATTDARYRAQAVSDGVCYHGCDSGRCGTENFYYENDATDCCECAPPNYIFTASFNENQKVHENSCMQTSAYKVIKLQKFTNTRLPRLDRLFAQFDSSVVTVEFRLPQALLAKGVVAGATTKLSKKAGVEDPGPIIGGAVGGGVILIGLLGFAYVVCRKKKEPTPPIDQGADANAAPISMAPLASLQHPVPVSMQVVVPPTAASVPLSEYL